MAVPPAVDCVTRASFRLPQAGPFSVTACRSSTTGGSVSEVRVQQVVADGAPHLLVLCRGTEPVAGTKCNTACRVSPALHLCVFCGQPLCEAIAAASLTVAACDESPVVSLVGPAKAGRGLGSRSSGAPVPYVNGTRLLPG